MEIVLLKYQKPGWGSKCSDFAEDILPINPCLRLFHKYRLQRSSLSDLACHPKKLHILGFDKLISWQLPSFSK